MSGVSRRGVHGSQSPPPPGALVARGVIGPTPRNITMDSMSTLYTLLRIAVLAYLGVLLLLWVMQDRLLFFPQPLPEGVQRVLGTEIPAVVELDIEARDGTRLHGWLRHTRASRPAPLVLYFGGNAEEVSGQIFDADRYAPFSVAALNYRGFGLSGGPPSEKALFDDALRIYDHLAAREDIDGERIVVFGRSLGSGVAVHVAAERPVAGVVLVSPYDSVRNVAQNLYPFAPIGLLLRHPFDSLARAPTLRMPVLMLAARDDAAIPSKHSRRLFDAWAGAKRWEILDGVGHNDIDANPGYWTAVADFLAGMMDTTRR